ncbi:tetratricopeptide repeat protein [Labrys miyagiensis]|nr:tetratricopeptide repeat protein [Labrys miyagiensis]
MFEGTLTTMKAKAPPDQADANEAYAKGRAALDKYSLDEARFWFGRCTQIAEGDPRGDVGLAQTAFLAGRSHEAARYWRAVVDRIPTSPSARLGQADTLMALGDFKGAIEAVESAESLAGANSNTILRRARLAVSQNQMEEACYLFATLRAAVPPRLEGFLEAAAIHMHDGDYAQATAIFESACELFPSVHAAHAGRALTLARSGDTERFSECLKEGRRRFPASPDWTYAQVEHLLANGNANGALRLSEELLAQHPERIEGLIAAARVAEALQDWGQARDAWTRIADRDDSPKEAPLSRLLCRIRLGEAAIVDRELPEHHDELRAGSSLGPQLLQAEIAAERGAYAEAAAIWQDMLAARPTSLPIRAALAKMLALSGRSDSAASVLDAAPQFKDHPALLAARLMISRATHDARATARSASRLLRSRFGRALAAAWLIEALVALGRERLAERLSCAATVIPTEHERLQASFMLRHATMRYTEAIELLENADVNARLGLDNWHCDALIRVGRTREAVTLARSAFVEEVGRGESENRRNALRKFVQELGQNNASPTTENAARYRRLTAEARLSVVNTGWLKRLPTHPIVVEFLQDVERRSGDAATLVDLVAEKLPTVLPHLRSGPLIAMVLFRKAMALYEIGEKYAAIECLREVLVYDNTTRRYYLIYKKLYREFVRPLQIENNLYPLVVILSCRKNLLAARLLSKQLHDFPHMIIIGDPESRVPLFDGVLLTLPCSDGYEGLPKKVAAAYEYLAITSTCKSCIKIDEDTYIENFERFRQMLADIGSSGADYAGEIDVFGDPAYHFGKCQDPLISIRPARHAPAKFCYGRAYYLSRKALGRFAEITRRFPVFLDDAVYEDVMVGEVMASVGIEPRFASLEHQGTLFSDTLD